MKAKHFEPHMIKEDLRGKPIFPGGSRLESPECGLAVYIKELLPNGGNVGLSSLSKVLTEEKTPRENGANSKGPCFGIFLNFFWGN